MSFVLRSWYLAPTARFIVTRTLLTSIVRLGVADCPVPMQARNKAVSSIRDGEIVNFEFILRD
jgi:hypothetical protein